MGRNRGVGNNQEFIVKPSHILILIDNAQERSGCVIDYLRFHMNKQKQLLIELVNQSNAFNYNTTKKTEQKAFDNKYKDNIIELVIECFLGHRAHKEAPQYFNLGTAANRRKTFKQFGDKDCFDYFNAKFQVFQEEIGYRQGSHTKAWSFTPEFKKRIDSLVTIAKGMKISSFNEWVTEVPEHEKVTYITPSISAMQRFFDDDTQETRDRLIMWAFIVAFATHKGRIPQYYKKGKKTGLYYPTGTLAITNMRACIRDSIMQDYSQYDLNCAAFAIIQGLTGDKFPTIDSYVNDPKAFRELIATECDMTIPDVKRCFFALSFGGRLTQYGGIAQHVSTQRLHEFRNNETVKLFREELKDATERLYDFYPEVLKAARDDRTHISGEYASKFRVRMYQARLNSILESIQDEYGLNNDKDDCLFVYDAIYIKTEMTINTLENAIKRDTGLEIRVTHG